MASTKEIKRRIKSVKNTNKITKAMELVAASKMKRAVSSTLASRLYAEYSWEILTSIAKNTDKITHPLFTERDKKDMEQNVLLVLITSNRGLCGAYNAQVIKKVLSLLKEKNDDINIDIGVGNGLEHLRGDPGLVGDAGDGDLGLFLINRNAANDDVFHFRSFGFHDGSWVVIEATADFEHDVKFLRELHRPRLHDFRAERGHFQHLVIADFKNLPGIRDDAGIGCIDAVHIGVNLTDIGFHCGGDGDGAEVAATTTERRDVTVGRFPLETGNDDSIAGVE